LGFGSETDAQASFVPPDSLVLTWFRVSSFGFRIRFGFRDSSFGFQVSDIGFRIYRFDIRVVSLKFVVDNLWFMVYGL